MQVPNVCFNENYCPILIDFDFVDVTEASRECMLHDFEIFIDDVKKHLCQLENFTQDELNKDAFLKIMEGTLDESLLEDSLMKTFNRTISELHKMN